MVTVRLTHIVRPSEAKPDEIMYLHATDQINEIAHTPTIYFYKHTAALDSTDPILRLKHSLSKALVLFYPLAGRLVWAAEGGGRVELHCNGKGVPIFEAESEAAVEDFGDFSPTPAMRSLFPPTTDYTTTPIDEIPVLTVQLTRFRCGGVSIVLGISHVIADGPSSLHFIDEWAKISRGGEDQVVIPPYLDRKVLDTYPPLSSAFDPAVLRPVPALIGQEDNLEQPRKIVAALLNLSKLQIENLRSKSNVNAVRRYTRFEAVAAHIWRCTTKARRHAAEQETSILTVADFRNKMNPPLPKNYFGNALIRVKAMDKSGSLLSNSVGAAAEKIHEAVERETEDTVRAYLEYLKGLPDVRKFRSLENDGRLKADGLRDPNLAIVSWTAMPLYGTDFGWGKEIHMGTLAIGADGLTFIIPSRDGDGAFNIVIWLQEQHMPDFKKYFYHDI
ncbi:hypothetical protein C2S53_017030 [Perilla frutescens var. hirtella]|uniref:Spermidine hydroxycinnamoyl transferase n=1 Tax=Perilla frutescens var. hirtella TaxID=608512 RepID=A0AAD4J3U4_PERFH|nr:hypothetical protein C2S53_017030 [Perilla frutescens var. hirtella]